jgi:hypothetical protein
MEKIKWSDAEKKIAHSVYEGALNRELSAVLLKFKEMAANAVTPTDMWAVEEYLKQQRHEIDSKYDYRYSQLIFVFGRLLREGWVEEEELRRLSEEKFTHIQRIAAF